MQYWIFPLIGFLSFYSNQKTNFGQIMDFKKNEFILNSIEFSIENSKKKSLEIHANPLESIKYSFHFHSLKKKNLIKNQDFLDRKKNLEKKLLMLESYEKKKMETKENLIFKNFSNSISLKKDLEMAKIYYNHISFFKNHAKNWPMYLWSQNFLYMIEKTGPKKFFLSVDLDSSNVQKSFSKNFKDSLDKKIFFHSLSTSQGFVDILLKRKFSKHPIYAYEKAKNFLDDGIRNSLLMANDFSEKNSGENLLIPISSLEKLKNQNGISEQNFKKSKLLLNFSILKNLNLMEGKNSRKKKILLKFSKFKKNQNFLESLIPGKPNLATKIVSKELKFDLERIFLLKKFQFKISLNKKFKKQSNIHLINNFLSPFQYIENHSLNIEEIQLKKIKKLKEKFLKESSIKAPIYQLSLLNIWKKALKISPAMQTSFYSRSSASLKKSLKKNNEILNKNQAKENSSISGNFNFITANKKYLSRLNRMQKVLKKFEGKKKNLRKENLQNFKALDYNLNQYLTKEDQRKISNELNYGIKLKNFLIKTSLKNSFIFSNKEIRKKTNFLDLYGKKTYGVESYAKTQLNRSYIRERNQKKFRENSGSYKLANLIESSQNFKISTNLFFKNLTEFYKKFSVFLEKIRDFFKISLEKKDFVLKKNFNKNLNNFKFARSSKLSNNKKFKKRFNKKLFNKKIFCKSLKKDLKQNNKKEKIFRSLLSYKSNGNFDSLKESQKNAKTSMDSLKKGNSFHILDKKTIQLKKRMKNKKIFQNNKNLKNQFYKKRKKILKNQTIFRFQTFNQKKLAKLKSEISLNQILKRIGFVYLHDLKMKQKLEQSYSQEKNFQKKRRKKKLKLENRRRKKRKRFYPRPIWLRYSLYKKYLSNRHSIYGIEKKKELKHRSFDSFKKIEKNKNQNEKALDSLSISSLKKKIYRKNKQKWGNFIQDTPSMEKICLKKGNFLSIKQLLKNKEYYKVSNRILAEFQPLCWKSYWFRSNLNPYMNRIEKNFSYMKEIEKGQNKANIFSFFSKIFGFFPYDFSISKFSMLPFYSDFKNSFDNQNLFYVSNFFLLERINKIAEYNRIEYERFSEILKNIKFNMNLEGQQKPKSAKFTAWKYFSTLKELKESNKKDFWRNFSYNLPPNLSETSPFVLFSNPFSKNSQSIKPYGSRATLRTLWAFNKTNIFSFKSQNQIQNLWEKTKLREQLKTNQTRKFFTNFFKNKKEFLRFKNLAPKKPNPNFSIIKKLNLSNLKLEQIGYKMEKSQQKFLNNKKVKKNFKILWDPKISKKIKSKNFYSKERFLIESQKQKPFLRFSRKKPRLFFPSQYFWASNKNFKGSFQLNPLTNHIKNDSIFEKKFGFYEGFQDSKKLIFYNLFLFSIFFHFCLFLSINRIPEFRSVAKFEILLLYKISKNYLIMLYKIYDLLKKYKKESSKMYNSLYFQTSKILKNFLDSNNKTELVSQTTFLFSAKNQKNFNQKNFNQKNFNQKNFNQKNFKKYEQNQNFSKKKQWKGFFQHPKISQKNWNSYFFYRNQLDRRKIEKSSRISSKDPFLWISSLNLEQAFFTKKILKTFSTFSKNRNLKFNKNQSLIYGTNFSINFLNKNQIFKKLQTEFALYLLYVSYSFVHLSIGMFERSYQILLKILDFFESFLFLIYKFLEKPAELMIEWIAQIFLIEWASDLSTFIPETFDIYFWNSFQKFFYNTRILSFLEFQNSSNFSANFSANFSIEKNLNFRDFYEQSRNKIDQSTNFLNFNLIYQNTLGFFLQRRLWNFFHFFMDSFYKPDIDLMVRQKKGKIFWDIWADILIRAAEQYNINIPSLTSLKEEQEKLIERLIQDPDFKNFSNHFEKKNFLTRFDRKNFDQTPRIEKIQTKSIFLSFKKWNLIEFQQKKLEKFHFSNFNGLKRFYKRKAWAINQSLTFNLKDTDLFLDFSPPKSFLYIPLINGYEPIQYTLGSILCEIYSGIFSKKVSKNLLIIHSQILDLPLRASLSSNFLKNLSFDFQSKPNYGSLIIQALAGESEIKIMIDNARRYATVQRGVAIGMKLLRDVFESIVFQTPCFFLMEDIHIIGERRPMLISDDENSYEKEFSIFGFEQDEESEKNQMIYQSTRHSIADFRKPYKGDFSMNIPTNLYEKNFYYFQTFCDSKKPISQKKYPIALKTVKKTLLDQANNNIENSKSKKIFNISQLEILSENFFAPPATSPFTILMLKEQRKFKPKKISKQVPWNSFVSENILEQKRENLRVKVAILADIALRNFSYNKDMITDLLVIIDGVRSNRGFVVFATTPLPSVLDPALRRPGRFDETLSLPFLPNLTNRWSIFLKDFHFQNLRDRISKDCFDRFDYGILTENFSFEQISNLIKKTKLGFLSNKDLYSIKKKINSREQILNSKLYEKVFFINPYNKKKNFLIKHSAQKNLQIHPNQSLQSFFVETDSKILSLNSKNFNSKKMASNISFGYYQLGHFLVGLDFLKDQTLFSIINKSSLLEQSPPFVFQTLLNESKMFQIFLMKLLGGKVAEFLGSKIFPKKQNQIEILFPSKNLQYSRSTKPNQTKFPLIFNYSYQDHMIRYKSWHFATSLIFSVLQKRFLYKKNFILSKMLTIDNPNQSSLKEPPSPPSSKILMPSKKYENFKRAEHDFQKKGVFSIFEKMQMHQKQRFLKKLYNKPIIDKFQSQLMNRFTSFESCFKEFAYNKNSILLSSSSSYPYYKNRFHLKHRFSLINQWWNGQLAEHNVEATYLSDIDWRTMYIKSNIIEGNFIPTSSKKKRQLTSSYNFSIPFDYILDFPDADQHYNPLKKRWFLNTNAWNYWATFETNIYYDVYFHMIYDSFNKTFSYFNLNREFLDFFLYTYNIKHSLKETDLIFILSRFYRR